MNQEAIIFIQPRLTSMPLPILQRLFYNGRARNTIFVHAISNLRILQTIREQSSGKKGDHLDSDLPVMLQLTQ